MPMPKGLKHTHGYATVTGDGMGYREIAEEMTKSGHTMNHASARNYFLRAMKKIAKPISKAIPGASIESIAADPRFQSAIAELLREQHDCVL